MRDTIFIIMIWIVVSYLSTSCFNQKSDIKRKKLGEFYVEANFINDSIINGTAKYYDSNNLLISKTNFTSGKKNGNSISYYPNGKLKDWSFFSDGKKNGFQYSYDPSENIEYMDYYYYDLQIGPIVIYNKGKIKEYYFIDFEGNTLLYINYDAFGKVKTIEGDLIHIASKNLSLGQNTNGIEILLYNLKPFGLEFQYQLGLINNQDSIHSITNLSDTLPFHAITLPTPPSDNNYCILLNKTNLDNAKKEVILRRIILD